MSAAMRRIDCHAHLVGDGSAGSGCWLRTPNVLRAISARYLLRATGMPASVLRGGLDEAYVMHRVAGETLGKKITSDPAFEPARGQMGLDAVPASAQLFGQVYRRGDAAARRAGHRDHRALRQPERRIERAGHENKLVARRTKSGGGRGSRCSRLRQESATQRVAADEGVVAADLESRLRHRTRAPTWRDAGPGEPVELNGSMA